MIYHFLWTANAHGFVVPVKRHTRVEAPTPLEAVKKLNLSRCQRQELARMGSINWYEPDGEHRSIELKTGEDPFAWVFSE